MDFVMRLIAAWRVELTLLAPPVALGGWAYLHFGPVLAGVLVALVLTAALLPPPSRRLLVRILHRAWVRRRLDVAFASLTGTPGERPPVVGRVTPTPGGDRVVLHLRHGTSIEDIERARSVVAASLSVRECRAAANADRKDRVTLTIVRRDPFSAVGQRSPLLDAERFDAWEPIPVGVDEDGELVGLFLPEHNVLFGAEPGGGKSVALSSLVAGCALDPTVHLWLFDGKLVELSAWRDCAERFIGPNLDLAISALEDLRTEMDARYSDLLTHKRRKVAPGEGWDLYVVVVDELALFVAGVDKKQANRFAELLRDLVARGRAAGVIVLAATQKPSVDIVPSALRDLFGFRWALRCATREASDTVLGSGWAAAGFSAADIDPGRRGVGLLLHEGGVPVRLRSFGLTDADVSAIATRAARLRHKERGDRRRPR